MPTRYLNFFGFIVCLILLGAAFYLQYQVHLQPCILCIIQRILFGLMAVVLFLAVIQNPKAWGIVVYAALTIFVGILGILVAGRQIWLQLQPPSPANDLCLPSFAYLIQQWPLSKVLQVLLEHGGSCRETWVWLGLTIPEWTLLCFLALLVLGCLQLIIYRKNSRVGKS